MLNLAAISAPLGLVLFWIYSRMGESEDEPISFPLNTPLDLIKATFAIAFTWMVACAGGLFVLERDAVRH